jgi:uncharacterized Tic20 family protein
MNQKKINDKSRSKNIHLGEVLLSGLLVPCGLALLLNMEHGTLVFSSIWEIKKRPNKHMKKQKREPVLTTIEWVIRDRVLMLLVTVMITISNNVTNEICLMTWFFPYLILLATGGKYPVSTAISDRCPITAHDSSLFCSFHLIQNIRSSMQNYKLHLNLNFT